MLQAAKKRLHGFDNVELRRGELEALPIDDARLDAATLMLVLHHVPEPERALAEVGARAQAGRPRSCIVDMLPHDRESYRQQMGHVWLGFSRRARCAACSRDAGFDDITYRRRCRPTHDAKGPGLFVATATREAQREGQS